MTTAKISLSFCVWDILQNLPCLSSAAGSLRSARVTVTESLNGSSGQEPCQAKHAGLEDLKGSGFRALSVKAA